MRAYKKSTKEQLSKAKEWIAQNPQGKLVEFLEATKGTESQFYNLRRKFGLAKRTPAVSEGIKKAHAQKKAIEAEARIIDMSPLAQKISILVDAIRKVETQNIELRVNNQSLQAQLKRLKEVINGSPV